MKILDPNGPEWLGLKKHMKARLEELSGDLEEQHPIEATQYLRGGIAELRSLIGLDEPEIIPDMKSVPYNRK